MKDRLLEQGRDIEDRPTVPPPTERGSERFSYKRFLTVTAFSIMSGYVGIMIGIGVSRWLDPEMTTMSVLAGNILGYAAPLILAKRFGVLD